MYYISFLENQSEMKLLIPKSIVEALDRVTIGNQNVNYEYRAYDKNYIVLTFIDDQAFPQNSFLSLKMYDKQGNLIDIQLNKSGIAPFRYTENTEALLVSLAGQLLIRFIDTSRIASDITKDNHVKVNVTTLLEIEEDFIAIDLGETNREQLKNLIIIAKKSDEGIYHCVPVLFHNEKYALIPQKYFSGKYNIHVILLIKSTVFKCSFTTSNKGIENNYMGMLQENYKKVNEEDLSTLQEVKGINPQDLKNKVIDLYVKNVNTDKDSFSFELNDEEVYFSYSKTPTLLLNKRKTDEFYFIEGYQEASSYCFKVNQFLKDTAGAGRWDIFLLGKRLGDNYSIYRLKHLNVIESKPRRFLNVFEQTYETRSTYNQKSRIYITNNNEISLVRNNLSNLIKEEFDIKTKIVKFSMKKNIVKLQVKLDSPYFEEFDLGNVYLIQRNKDGLFKKGYPISKIKDFQGSRYISCSIDLFDEQYFPLYWDVYLGIVYNGKEYFIRVSKVSKDVFRDVDNTITKYQLNVSNDYIMYPYITISNDLSFTFRKREFFENRYYLLKENIAFYFVNLFYRYFSKKDIWIGFEKLAMSAHDSGYHFFDYIYKNKKHENFYYVIRKGSPEEDNLKGKKDKVLYFMSFKYFVYMFSARLLISSDTKRNSYNLSLKKSKLAKALTDKKLVYLQHGVNGLKVVKDFYKNRGVFDLVIAPSEYERKMIIDHWGYDESEVVTTGLARWDVLKDKTDQVDYRQIFVMPTWRTWMDGMTKEKFLESEYFIKYNEFLSSERLHTLLKENNVRIKFFLHPKFRDYIDLFNFNSDHIEKFGFLEVPLDEMIMRSSLMISDYSSVIWEMFYLKKPCVFFHFDRDKYLDYEGSYMDLDKDLFGDVTYDTETLVDTIESYIKNEFKEKEHYGQLRNKYFTYIDKNNSERIYKAIQENKDMLYKDNNFRKWKPTHIIPFKLRRMGLSAINRLLKK